MFQSKSNFCSDNICRKLSFWYLVTYIVNNICVTKLLATYYHFSLAINFVRYVYSAKDLANWDSLQCLACQEVDEEQELKSSPSLGHFCELSISDLKPWHYLFVRQVCLLKESRVAWPLFTHTIFHFLQIHCVQWTFHPLRQSFPTLDISCAPAEFLWFLLIDGVCVWCVTCLCIHVEGRKRILGALHYPLFALFPKVNLATRESPVVILSPLPTVLCTIGYDLSCN